MNSVLVRYGDRKLPTSLDGWTPRPGDLFVTIRSWGGWGEPMRPVWECHPEILYLTGDQITGRRCIEVLSDRIRYLPSHEAYDPPCACELRLAQVHAGEVLLFPHPDSHVDAAPEPAQMTLF